MVFVYSFPIILYALCAVKNMFLSIFSLAIAAKLHISRQRYYFFRTYASAKHIFLIKSHNLPLFALFFAFSTTLPRTIYRALPDLQRSELPTTARPASNLFPLRYSSAINYGRYTVDTRYIYGRYTVH